jgi:hypothetical protein
VQCDGAQAPRHGGAPVGQIVRIATQEFPGPVASIARLGLRKTRCGARRRAYSAMIAARHRPRHCDDARRRLRRERGPRAWRGGRLPSVGGIPDDGKDAVIILAGGAAEIGIDLARSELGCGQRQAHIILAAGFPAPGPACADLDALGDDAEVGLGVRTLVAVGNDVDVGPDRDCLELALEAAIVELGDVSDRGHGLSPLMPQEPIPCDGKTEMGSETPPNPSGAKRQRRTRANGFFEGEAAARSRPLAGEEKSWMSRVSGGGALPIGRIAMSRRSSTAAVKETDRSHVGAHDADARGLSARPAGMNRTTPSHSHAAKAAPPTRPPRSTGEKRRKTHPRDEGSAE